MESGGRRVSDEDAQDFLTEQKMTTRALAEGDGRRQAMILQAVLGARQ